MAYQTPALSTLMSRNSNTEVLIQHEGLSLGEWDIADIDIESLSSRLRQRDNVVVRPRQNRAQRDRTPVELDPYVDGKVREKRHTSQQVWGNHVRPAVLAIGLPQSGGR
jgi:hypothetical protein